MMSSNEDSASNDDQLSSPASPIHPMATDWSNTMDAQEVSGAGGGGGGGGISNGSLHGSLHELSPIWADSDLIGDVLSVAGAESPADETAFANTSNRSVPFPTFQKPHPLGLAAASTSASTGAGLSFGPMESFEEKVPLELPTKTRLKVRIKQLNIVGGWRWMDGKEDACGICRTPFETCCMDCKFPGDECPLVERGLGL
uniref:Anaphase-promoting complex subunit 11 RING-H2 finger domain-containing protein n=1 Tax=Globodera rostochiensis TaxID=31243 RepID=A0A914HIY3_GLORO